MPEVLGGGGLYFDPEAPAAIDAALMKLIESPQLRDKLAGEAYARARVYSWKKCADETLAFIGAVAAG